jgi:hypothetical protein
VPTVKRTFAVAGAGVPRQPQHAGGEWTYPSVGVLLESAALQMIDADLPARRWADEVRHADAGVLMREECFELKSLVQRHVDDHSDRGCAIDIDLSSSDELEEVATEAIPTKWRDLHALRADGRRAHQAQDTRNRADDP